VALRTTVNQPRRGFRPFGLATEVCKDPFVIERLDDRENEGEDRFILIGSAEGAILSTLTHFVVS
jgi:uncharacterized DUF497 family protein